MKKFTFSTLLVLIFVSYHINSQTIVGTTPENKNVILEEFTGIHCSNCPSGHAIAQGIQNAHPDDVFLINIHTGSYANPSAGDPDFRTSFGSLIAGQSGLLGYPAGTVNRHLFPGYSQGSGTAQSRGSWSTTSNQTLGQSAYVNVGVEAELDVITRELTVHVEAYYTGDSPQSSNLLNVALLQDNTLGPQVGGGVGNNYNHMHRLVHMLTGQWGETISNTSTDSFIDETFTYIVPNDFNAVPVEIVDLKIVAFVTETHQEVANGSGCNIDFTNLSGNDIGILNLSPINDPCEGEIQPVVEIINSGEETLTSLAISYDINGEAGVYTWTGSLGSLYTETIEIPSISFELQPSNTFNLSIPSDDNSSNNSASTNFNEAPLAESNTVFLEIQTDNSGSECTWIIKKSSGIIVAGGNNYANNTTINETINLPGQDCYTIEVTDSNADGGTEFTLTDINDDTLYYNDGSYLSFDSQLFKTPIAASVEDIFISNVNIFPNPANTQININNAAGLSVELFDLLGRIVYAKENISIEEQINISSINNGTYLLKLTDGVSSKTEKIVIMK